MIDWVVLGRAVQTALNIAGILGGMLILWRVPAFRKGESDQAPADDSGGVTVLIPARNEAGRLPTLLQSLAGQTGCRFETLVVDDGSEDRTVAIAEEAGARVLRAPAPPPGWTGKSWACWNGAKEAKGEILVFLDADVVLEPEALASLVSLYRTRYASGALSVQPYHITYRPYEQLSLFFNLIVVAGMDVFTPVGERRRSLGAFGPCLVIGRETYFATGGHEAVRAAIHEDVAMGRRLVAAGLPVGCRVGRGAVSFRMYGEGLRGLVEGWSKNFATGAACVSWPVLILLVLWIGAGIALAAWLVFLPDRWAALGAYLLYGIALWRSARLIGRFPLMTCLLYPIPLLFFLSIFARSVWLKRFRGRVVWKGRSIEL